MTLVNLPVVPANPSMKELTDIVAELSQQLEYLLNGFMSSDNAREFGGWQIGKTEMQSKDKRVGMSTNNVGADPIRFWAGDTINGAPNFQVTEAGKVTLKSSSGYPRIELNSPNNLIGAYTDPDTYISFLPSYNSVPALVLVDVGTIKAFLNRGNAVGGTTLGTFDGEPLNFQASGSLNLQPDGNLQINNVNGWSGSMDVVTSVVFGPTGGGSYSTKRITVTKGIITNYA